MLAQGITPEEFRARRAAIVDRIGGDAVAVLQGGAAPRVFEVFRQTNTFTYCCGIEIPRAYLLIRGSDGAGELFLASRGAGESAEGQVFGHEDAEAITAAAGLDAVRPHEALAEAIRTARLVYTPYAPSEVAMSSRDVLTHGDRLAADDLWDGATARDARFRALLTARCPNVAMRDLTPIIDELRAIKSPAEIALCHEAGRLSALGVLEAMKATRPGLREYHLQAIADYTYMTGGARGEGYRAIVASGENAWYGHYNANDAELRDGDLVLMDCAPDYHYYTSDIGRMWPIDGQYADWQRELYGFVVEYHKALLSLIKPGRGADAIQHEAAELMKPVHQQWPWSKDAYRAAGEAMFTFQGHLSHPVGMAVHDLGHYRGAPLKPGTVFTVDPQMWVREERLYIRCEDTVVVTESGIENLTALAPLELDEVESIVGTRSSSPPFVPSPSGRGPG